jgi:hypothetical protein
MKLEEQQFEKLKQLNTALIHLKLEIGDVEIRKSALLREIDGVRTLMLEQEQELVKEYGPDAVINMQTGEVTQKENEST